jgi:ribosomal protein S18 acetylase RimI-like enzyme
MASEISLFIASMNSVGESYVGYCGTNPAEIESTIRNFDAPTGDAFLLDRVNGKVTALLGFDIDPLASEAEVWGPFVNSGHYQEDASALWQAARKELIGSIKKLNFFYGSKNRSGIEFARSLGAEERSENSILVLSAAQRRRQKKDGLPCLSAARETGFIRLHDSLFPSAYLSGQEICDLLDENNKVFILERHRELAGYIYVEVKPAHRESTIHFFGVDQKHRGLGFGQQLLSAGVDFILGFDQINEITLCVESQNQRAIRLYERIGFVERHKCIHFTLQA